MEERIKEYLIGQYGDKCCALDELSEGLIELGFLMENANDVPIRCLPGLYNDIKSCWSYVLRLSKKHSG